MKVPTQKFAGLVIALACTIYAASPAVVLAELTDDEIRDRIIQQSLARYPGNCPCPYNVDRAGRQCGGRSAWSKPGGAAPLCFREDISDDMIGAWRAQNSG